jgi:hypothetical protein
MLILRNETVTAITKDLARLPDEQPESKASVDRITEAANNCGPLSKLARLAKSVLEEQGFVQIRGFSPTQARPVFLALASLLGEIYIDPSIGSAIVPAHVRPGEMLMGNHLRRLPLHTDYSMLEQPPRLTMSFCLRPDPVEEFGAVYVADMESVCFGLEDDAEISRLKTVPLPFAARNAREEIDVIDKPILSKTDDGRLLVRYHRLRICQGFQVRGARPNGEQLSAMRSFERLAAAAVQVLHLKAGDITVIDNHRVVHGRERCSVEVDVDGTTTGRQMLFVFAY